MVGMKQLGWPSRAVLSSHVEEVFPGEVKSVSRRSLNENPNGRVPIPTHGEHPRIVLAFTMTAR